MCTQNSGKKGKLCFWFKTTLKKTKTEKLENWKLQKAAKTVHIAFQKLKWKTL